LILMQRVDYDADPTTDQSTDPAEAKELEKRKTQLTVKESCSPV